MHTKFTDRYLAALKAEGSQRFEISDEGCKGLSIRVTASRKTFCFRFKRKSRMQHITLGEYPTMTLKQAAVAANRRYADLHDGRNPVAEAQREAVEATSASDGRPMTQGDQRRHGLAQRASRKTPLRR
jgi:hypothetical protein